MPVVLWCLVLWLVCLCLVLCDPSCWWHLLLVVLCGHQCTSAREWSVHLHLRWRLSVEWASPQDVRHLFDCTTHPTDLSPEDLWRNPVGSIRAFSYLDNGNLDWHDDGPGHGKQQQQLSVVCLWCTVCSVVCPCQLFCSEWMSCLEEVYKCLKWSYSTHTSQGNIICTYSWTEYLYHQWQK